MSGLWGRLEREAPPGKPIPGRPLVEDPRWRPWEPSNPFCRPRDLQAYLSRFRVSDPMGKAAGASTP